MQIIIEPGSCPNIGRSFCESCFSSFLLHGCYPDRACIVDVVDDGKDAVTLLMRYDGHEIALVITDLNRELIAYAGWSQFVPGARELTLHTAEVRGSTVEPAGPCTW